MRKLDRAFATETVRRLGALAADANPKWGRLTVDGVIDHFVGFYEYSMGEGESLPLQRQFRFRKTIGFGVMNGIISIPKNVRFSKKDGTAAPIIQTRADADRLLEVQEEFIVRVERGERDFRAHPVFGTLTPQQWLKFHYRHNLHHLNQFGA